MNKKFSTLMMGGMLLAVPSLVSAQSSFKLNDKTLKKVEFAAATDGEKTYSDVLVIRDANGDGEISSGDLILIATTNDLGKIEYKSASFDSKGVANVPNEVEAIWNLVEKNLADPNNTSNPAWYYGLQSKNTGKYLTVNGTNNPYVAVDNVAGSRGDMGQDVDKYLTSYFITGTGNSAANRLSAAHDTLRAFVQKQTTIANDLLIHGNQAIAFGDASTYTDTNFDIILATADSRTVGTETDDYVDELNDVKGGKGFEFEVITEAEGVLDNIFDGLELRAFRVDITPTTAMAGKDSIGWPAKGTNVANYYEIPAGVYLATEWSQLDDATLANNTITTKEEFLKATFIAVSPTDWVQLTNTVRANGVGFALTTVKGSDMNFYAAQTSKEHDVYDASQESRADEVYVGNACFTITVPKPLSDNDQYQLSVADARIDKEGKGTQVNANTTLYISEIKNTNNVDDVANPYVYLLTNTGSPATLQAVPSSTIADVTELLNEDATPAIYAVKFLSGEDDEVSEYGQYLTFVNNSGWKAAIMPNVNEGANEDDPLYQFVVTGVEDNDGDDEGNYETIVLTNRLTKQFVRVVLYTEDKENNIYTIYPAINKTTGKVNRNEEWLVAYTDNADKDKLKLDGKSIRGMQVQLIEQENVDKFATFETAKSEEGLYTFEFAKTAESGDRLYAAAKRNTAGEIEWENQWRGAPRVVTSKTADQFELIRVKNTDKTDKVTYLLNDFIYKSNDRVMNSQIEKDTVAFYSYNVRFFAPDEETPHYLNAGNLAAAASEYVIKYNLDGSVSLFDAAATNDFVNGSMTPTNTIAANINAEYLVVDAELQNAATINEDENIDRSAWDYGDYYKADEVANIAVKTFMVPATVYGTLNPVPQTTEFEDVNGFGYVNMNAKKQAILLPAESMTFRLDTVDTDVNIPSFYISKDNNFLYFAADSAESYRLTDWTKYEFENGDGRATRLIFKAGELVDDSQALQTMVDGRSVKVAEKADRVNDVFGGLNYFKFQVLESGDGDDTYVIYNRQANRYVININGNLTLGSNRDGATRFVVNPQEATANEDVISASSVKVIAGAGQITINGAAGKKVVVSNILGQVVANTVITSDNATIAAPQGIVVVAVEGEEAVKAIVK